MTATSVCLNSCVGLKSEIYAGLYVTSGTSFKTSLQQKCSRYFNIIESITGRLINDIMLLAHVELC